MKNKATELAKKYNWSGNISPIMELLENIKNKSRVIIAFSGKMGAGKDSAGLAFAEEELNSRGYLLQHFSYATPLRAEITEIVNKYNQETDKEYAKELGVSVLQLRKLIKILNGESVFQRSPEARAALQYWGTDVRRKKNVNYWINKAFEYILNELGNSPILKGFYITDPRFPNEVELIEDLGGLVVRLDVDEDLRKERLILRDGIEPTEEALNHISEVALDNYPFKNVIHESFATTRTPEQVAKSAYKIFMDKEVSVILSKPKITQEKRKKLNSILDRINKENQYEELERSLQKLFGRKVLVKILKQAPGLYIIADWETGQHYVCDKEDLAEMILQRDFSIIEKYKCGKNPLHQWIEDREVFYE